MERDTYRRRVAKLRTLAEIRIKGLRPGVSADEVRKGCRYVLDGGGKRIRSTLVMLSCQAVGGSAMRALDAAVALEMMHNFTLVHDDVMDNAHARRGRPTVHKKWNVNSAILVGDVLIGEAYRSLMRVPGKDHRNLSRVFTAGLLEVCDGQALDLEFETRNDVSVREYFRMIGKKTGCLLATATELGGRIGGGTRAQVQALRMFGLRLGCAFQIQDDLLDVVADPRDFGKTTGGDILEGKKTFLLLTAAERTTGEDRAFIGRVMMKEQSRSSWKTGDGRITQEGRAIVAAVKDIYERHRILDDARRLVRRNTAIALQRLNSLPDTIARRTLAWLAAELITRAS